MPYSRFVLAFLISTLFLAGQTPLRDAASKRALLFGAAANADEFGIANRLNEPDYARTLSSQFNMLQPENAMKWNPIHPERDRYDFGPGDKLVAFAASQQMKVRGHVLLWHQGLPTWLTDFAKTAAPAEMSTILREHIRSVMTHYKDKIFAWDVANEVVSDSSTANGTLLRDSVWFNQPGIGLTGTAYVEQVFRWAHEDDPNALLFYNDYNIEGLTPKFRAVLNMVKDFVGRGVPIHGVGLQMHLSPGNFPSTSDLTSVMKQITDLGLQVQITEMDVRLPLTNGLPSAADLAAQAQTYARILTVCLQNPGCTAVQTWGFTDKYSWIPGFFTGFGAALPFDAAYQPKSAVPAMLNTLESVPPTLSSSGIVNAASYTGGAVAPGELVTIFGARYGPPSILGAQFGPDNRLVGDLGGARVLFDGVPAPFIYALAGQVSVIVPYEVQSRQQTVVQYEYNGVKSNPVTMPVAQAAPGIFSANSTGTGQGSVLNQDNSVNATSSPAPAGSVVTVFATGGGAVVGGAINGGVAPPVAGNQVLPLTATIGGLNATVLYSGPAPSLVNGVLQVNLTVPAGLSPGPQPLVIRIGGITSQAGITVSVQ
jgi:endo-1,4-beta-xylanase